MRQAALVVAASLLMDICGRFVVPLPFTPVPLSLANFAVILIGLTLGSRRAFAALVLYLAQGVAGMPVFNPLGPGGIAQLLGPTGGYLMAYPVAAFLAGWIAERGPRTALRCSLAAVAGNLLVFAGGVSWLMVLTHGAVKQATYFGLYPFLFAEVVKIMVAVSLAVRVERSPKFANLLS